MRAMPISQQVKTKNYIDSLPTTARKINVHSALALFVARLAADDPHDAFAAHDLALSADFFDRGLNTHLRLLSSTHLARNTMRARLKS
jgi:hypothetical protein